MIDNFRQYLIDIKPKTINEWVTKAKMLKVLKSLRQYDLSQLYTRDFYNGKLPFA